MAHLHHWDNLISQSTFTSSVDYRKQILELIEQAKLAEGKLHKFMAELSANINNESGKPITYTRAPLKTKGRIGEKCGIKVWSDPSRDVTGMKTPLEVKDIARATIVFSTVAQMLAFRDYIYNTPEYQAVSGLDTPAVKDLWAKGVTDEYKDVKFFLQVNIDFSYGGNAKQKVPHIVELQLNVAQMDRGKSYGHAFYNISRAAVRDGKVGFFPADKNCKIVIPANKKGRVGNKLRTALSQCKSMAGNDSEINLAINIMRKMLKKKFQTVEEANKKQKKADAANTDAGAGAASSVVAYTNAKGKPADKYDFVDDGKPLVIVCGVYNPKKEEKQDTDAAQAWAIARLSSFIWSNFTAFQNKPGVTGIAANIHEA